MELLLRQFYLLDWFIFVSQSARILLNFGLHPQAKLVKNEIFLTNIWRNSSAFRENSKVPLNLRPFYRIEQLIIIPKNQNMVEREDPFDFTKTQKLGSIFRKYLFTDFFNESNGFSEIFFWQRSNCIRRFLS